MSSHPKRRIECRHGVETAVETEHEFLEVCRQNRFTALATNPIGTHAIKIGDRFAALQPIAQGLLAEFGATGADAARGLSLRIDHGTQYTADDFLNQIKFWGIAPSFAFVAELQTNGVAERFNRTLREQAIYGRVFRNVEEVRAIVTEFKERYNRLWRLEKLGFMSPLEARQAYALRKAA